MRELVAQATVFATEAAVRAPLLVLLLVVAVALAGGIVPGIPVEPLLLGIAVVAPDAMLLPLIVAATTGQMAAKTMLCAGACRFARSLSAAHRARMNRTCQALTHRPRLQVTTLLGSAIAGLPPFYLTTIAYGVLRLPLRTFVALGTAGRAIRFAAVVLAPQLLAT